MPVTDTTSRHCSRCYADLTDFASRERGQGPICAGKDTHLYAKTIPANFALAVTYALNINPTSALAQSEECQCLWESAIGKLLKKAQRAQQRNDDINRIRLTGEDTREVVKACDFLLSWVHPSYDTKPNLIGIVKALGYVGLAGVLEGKASTGEAKVWLDNDRLYLSGSANTSGFRAMRRIPGVRCPSRRGDKSPYSVPASEFEAFKTTVMTCWPMYEMNSSNISWETLETDCKAYVVAGGFVDFARAISDYFWTPASTTTGSPSSTPTMVRNNTNTGAQIKLRTDDFVLTFDWDRNRNMWSFVGKIKSLPSGDRKYEPIARSWSLKNSHLETVKTWCKELYGQDPVIARSTEVTPTILYRAPHRRGSYYSRTMYYRRY